MWQSPILGAFPEAVKNLNLFKRFQSNQLTNEGPSPTYEKCSLGLMLWFLLCDSYILFFFKKILSFQKPEMKTQQLTANGPLGPIGVHAVKHVASVKKREPGWLKKQPKTEAKIAPSQAYRLKKSPATRRNVVSSQYCITVTYVFGPDYL